MLAQLFKIYIILKPTHQEDYIHFIYDIQCAPELITKLS